MNYKNQITPAKEIMAQSFAQYATVKPKGILLPFSDTLYNPFVASIISYKPARTYYINRKPFCRSLNGVRSVNQKKLCPTCDDIRVCTPQIALELDYKRVPLRLMLAYTSAKNFILFCQSIHKRNIIYQGLIVAIKIINRGKWGEATFYQENP